MTTDAETRCISTGRKLLRSMAVLVSIVFAWIAAMAVIVIAIDAPDSVLVVAPGFELPQSIDKDIYLVRGTGPVFVMASNNADYVKRLHGAGAWLVLPSLRNGCLDLNAYRNKAL